jgi:hypothetical protein
LHKYTWVFSLLMRIYLPQCTDTAICLRYKRLCPAGESFLPHTHPLCLKLAFNKADLLLRCVVSLSIGMNENSLDICKQYIIMKQRHQTVFIQQGKKSFV